MSFKWWVLGGGSVYILIRREGGDLAKPEIITKEGLNEKIIFNSFPAMSRSRVLCLIFKEK